MTALLHHTSSLPLGDRKNYFFDLSFDDGQKDLMVKNLWAPHLAKGFDCTSRVRNVHRHLINSIVSL